MNYTNCVTIYIGTDGEYYEFEEVPRQIITQVINLLFDNGKRGEDDEYNN